MIKRTNKDIKYKDLFYNQKKAFELLAHLLQILSEDILSEQALESSGDISFEIIYTEKALAAATKMISLVLDDPKHCFALYKKITGSTDYDIY